VPQVKIAELFDKDRKTITQHIKNIYSEEELDKNSTSLKFELVRKEGDREVSRNIEHYSLDVVLAVGYRVKSKRGTQFRQWATRIIKEYAIRGYVINTRKLDILHSSVAVIKNDIRLLKEIANRPIINQNHIHIDTKDIGLTTKQTQEIKTLFDELLTDLKKKDERLALSVAEELNSIDKDPKRFLQFVTDLNKKDSFVSKTVKWAVNPRVLDAIFEILKIVGVFK